MPQDADGYGLISLLWAAWFYWIFYLFLEYVSSLGQAKTNSPECRSFGPTSHTGAVPSLAGTAAPSHLEALVSEILRRDSTATIEDFLSERLADYETIVSAFNSDDLTTLRELVSTDVYDAFANAIGDEQAHNKERKTVFSSIDPPKIVDGLIDNAHMEISVRFVGEYFRLSRNSDEETTSAAPDRHQSIDVWTFERELSSRDKTWRVVATEAGV